MWKAQLGLESLVLGDSCTSSQSLLTSQSVMPRSVAIVGAGACGLVCARECIRSGLHVRVFEQSTVSGGTWILNPVPPELQTMNVMSDNYVKQASTVHSSMYEQLRTNLPRELMGFLDFPFDEAFGNAKDLRRHCCHQEVRRYLEAFKRHFQLDRLIQYQSTVVRIEHIERPLLKWDVEIQSNGKCETFQFDGVIVANGHFTVPYIPDIKGIDQFKRRSLHSHLYRHPSSYKNQTVVLLGNSKSGRDLAEQIGGVARDVYLCGRTWPSHVDRMEPVGAYHNIHLCPTIEACMSEGQLKLKGGQLLTDVDVLIFCTGYRHDYPFLKGSCSVSTDNWMVYPLYKHLLHGLFPTLAIANIHQEIVSFVWAEQQAKFIARVFSGCIPIPDVGNRMKEIHQDLEQHKKQDATMKSFLVMNERQINYFTELAALAGDPDPIPEWWKRMRVITKEFRERHHDDFRDRVIDEFCFNDAREYFATIRRHYVDDSSSREDRHDYVDGCFGAEAASMKQNHFLNVQQT